MYRLQCKCPVDARVQSSVTLDSEVVASGQLVVSGQKFVKSEVVRSQKRKRSLVCGLLMDRTRWP